MGAGLVWLVVLDSRRREVDVTTAERPREATWIATTLSGEGFEVGPDVAERVLELHELYLRVPPPDGPEIELELAGEDGVGVGRRDPDLGE